MLLIRIAGKKELNNDPYIAALFRKYLDCTIDKVELEDLLAYFEIEEDHEGIKRLIRHELEETNLGDTNKEIEWLLVDVKQKLDSKIHPQGRSHFNWTALAIAASFVIIVSSVIYLTTSRPLLNKTQTAANSDIGPGSNKATLTLSSGKVIELDGSAELTLAEERGIRIEKGEDGTITYLPGKDTKETAGELVYNTIQTPRGGQYRIVLPDGSKVWLNAASSLKYSLSFGPSERTVEISGEAYFEIVAQKNHPFIVKSADQDIKVLGTSFNVNAYANEPFTTTTLEEGAVIVFNKGDNKSVKLKPGQQVISRESRFEVRSANAIDQTAWKDGLIVLTNADLPTIMRQIERWYDVSFEMNRQIPRGTFSGELPRNIKLSELLEALRVNTGINFKVEGRRILPVK